MRNCRKNIINKAIRAGTGIFFLIVLCASAEPKRVLILDPYGRDIAPFSTLVASFRNTLARESGDAIDFHDVSLDMARFTNMDAEDSLVAFLEKRIKDYPIDLVVPFGGPALQFATRHRDRLFPGIPVLAVGPDPRFLAPDFLQTNSALVTHQFNIPGTIEDILQLLPHTTNIAVVMGSSPLERFWGKEIQREVSPLTNRIGFMWLHDLTLEQTLEKCRAMPPNSAIFCGLYLIDAAGVPSEKSEALRRIHEIANAPLFGLFESEFGLGIMGGHILFENEIGERGARTAVRILRGERPESIPAYIHKTSVPVYDWRELNRWDISESRLPPGSIVQFRQPSVWKHYMWWIVAFVLVCLIEATIILVLILNRAQRQRAEKSLRESDDRLRAVLDTAVDGIITISERGTIESVNAATETLFGYSSVELIGNNVNILMPSPYHDEHDQYISNYLQSGVPRIIGIGREVTGKRKDGSVFPLELSVSEIRLIDRRVFTGFVRDISERKQAEHLAREFSRRLIRAQEDERSRLARELHDDMTQRVALMAIDAGRLQGGVENMPEATAALRLMREGLIRLSEDIHVLSYRLHPSLLEELGLIEALKVECNRFSRQSNIPIDVNLEELSDLISPETRLCLFRVTQEALRNVKRHAKASKVEVSLRILDGGLHLAVIDDGVGFNFALQRNQPSLGLASMRERVFLLEGELDIDSTPGKGTIVLAWVPVKKTIENA